MLPQLPAAEPPPPPKTVLDEDEYVRRVKAIILRDFFPGTAPETSADPRLDVFLARYTTQDNAEFNAVMQQQRDDFARTRRWRFLPDFRRLCAPPDALLFPPPARQQDKKPRGEIVYTNTRLLIETELQRAPPPPEEPPDFLFTLDDTDRIIKNRLRRIRKVP